jgi:Lsr2
VKEVIIQSWDDYDLLHDGRKVHAENTVRIGIDGKWRELDLSDANVAKLRGMFDPWWLCGRTPDKEVREARNGTWRPDREDADIEPAPGVGKRGSPERRAYLAGLREWADANGHNYTSKATVPGGAHGSFYYPRKLVTAYNEYLRQQAMLNEAEQKEPEPKAG